MKEMGNSCSIFTPIPEIFCSVQTQQVLLHILNKLAGFQTLTKTAGDTAVSSFLARTYLLLKTN